MARLAEIETPDALLARAREGDNAARGELYQRLAPATFGLIRRLVSQRAVAEDLFQDTMISFFEQLERFRGEAPLGAWLRQIAVSKCLMHLRSPWHRARLRLDGAILEGESELSGWIWPANLPVRPESFDLERALSTLSPTARAVLWLFEVEGYSHEEIGRAFGRSTGFSKSQLSRAHAKLRLWFSQGSERVSKSCTPV